MENLKAPILIKNGYVFIPENVSDVDINRKSILTVTSNLAYYGYVLSVEAYNKLGQLSDVDINIWWISINSILRELTGDSLNISKHVVYKNFPQEVLDMSECDYWINQIMIHWFNVPYSAVAEKETVRPTLNEFINLKVLHLADDSTINNVLRKLLYQPTKWSNNQFEDIKYILNGLIDKKNIDICQIPFKENMVNLANIYIQENIPVSLKSATDVLRLATGLSNGDISLKTNTRFIPFKNNVRKYLLNLIESIPQLTINQDLAMRQGQWKKLLYTLRPNSYGKKYPKTSEAYDLLLKGKLESFNAMIERNIKEENSYCLEALVNRGGDFARRLRKLLEVYDQTAVDYFKLSMDNLTVFQLLKLKKYFLNINDRKYNLYTPKGNWEKAQLSENSRKPLDKKLIDKLVSEISDNITIKLSKTYPNVRLSPDTANIKLSTNDSDLMSYGKGTIFTIPDNITFIRTASYWKHSNINHSIFYDNTWNFFDENWVARGHCAYDNVMYMDKAAIFSGDPSNINAQNGEGAQLIDLYIDKLIESGVRYALWSNLSYSGYTYDTIDEVFASLEWGEKPLEGNLFEPSRCQLSFRIKGNYYNRYVAYIDLIERKLIYVDTTFKSSVRTASKNYKILSNLMPPFVEYLKGLPSVYDLFSHLPNEDNGLPVLYSDDDIQFEEKDAYVFKTENANNKFNQINISDVLNLK